MDISCKLSLLGHDLHEISVKNKKTIINLLSAEHAHKVVKVKKPSVSNNNSKEFHKPVVVKNCEKLFVGKSLGFISMCQGKYELNPWLQMKIPNFVIFQINLVKLLKYE